MRVGWLSDKAGYIGGAEMTQSEFRAAAPDGVEIVDCPPSEIQRCDRYVIQNCVTYSVADLEDCENLAGNARVFKYWHDVGPHLFPAVHEWLKKYAGHICCSPIQADYMGLKAHLIPPPVDLTRFEEAAQSMNGDRSGAVCIGSWRNYGKAPHKAAEYTNGKVDFFGGGPFAPQGSREVPYEVMPGLLASYERFVYLPTVIEPFGRLVAEAWAAGCEVVTNDLVGARYWIDGRAEAIESAASDFWRIVLDE